VHKNILCDEVSFQQTLLSGENLTIRTLTWRTRNSARLRTPARTKLKSVFCCRYLQPRLGGNKEGQHGNSARMARTNRTTSWACCAIVFVCTQPAPMYTHHRGAADARLKTNTSPQQRATKKQHAGKGMLVAQTRPRKTARCVQPRQGEMKQS
jgi:hypothetical protein